MVRALVLSLILSILPWTIAPNAGPKAGENLIRQSQAAPTTLLWTLLIGVTVSPVQQQWFFAAVYSARWFSPSAGQATRELEFTVNTSRDRILAAPHDD